MGQVSVDDLALVDEASFLHDSLRSVIGRHCEANDVGEMKPLEANLQAYAGNFGGKPLAPIVGHERVSEFDFFISPDNYMTQAAAPHKFSIGFIAKDPKPEAMLVPVRIALVEKRASPCFFSAYTAQGGHDFFIAMHSQQLIKMSFSDALNNQAIGVKTFSGPHVSCIESVR